MKKVLFFCFILYFCSVFAQSQETYKIYSKNSREAISIENLAEEISNYDVIFFGEFHENTLLHSLEIELLKALWQKNPRIAVSMEMFERDAQNSLDEYLKNKISEKEFLEKSRPWPNYESDYKPLVTFAKEKKLPVIAANIPRDYASQISKNGITFFDSLQNKKFAASKIIVYEGEYKDKFFATMREMSHASPMMKNSVSDEKLYNLFAAQCLKDDTMAESIHLFTENNKKHKVIHFNGDFHSNSFLGTVEKLQAMNPKLSIAVITPIVMENEFTYPENHAQEADFFIVIPPFE
jgi:uncharacterized iron-regulated protein